MLPLAYVSVFLCLYIYNILLYNDITAPCRGVEIPTELCD
nr:MAG TPA: N-term cysteine-rich ER, FAM69 [Caudoviricetes sp.]